MIIQDDALYEQMRPFGAEIVEVHQRGFPVAWFRAEPTSELGDLAGWSEHPVLRLGRECHRLADHFYRLGQPDVGKVLLDQECESRHGQATSVGLVLIVDGDDIELAGIDYRERICGRWRC